MMILVTQAIKQTYKFIPLFIKQAEKHGAFDHYYFYTDQEDIYGIDEYKHKCTFIQGKDLLFAGNILKILEKVKSDEFFLILEDFVLANCGNKKKEIDACCKFFVDHKDAGFLRMNFRKTPLAHPKRRISAMPRSYDSYVCLQPAIWRRSYLVDILSQIKTHGDLEKYGPSIAARNKKMNAYSVNKTVLDTYNCLVKGDMTPGFIELLVENKDSFKEYTTDHPYVYVGGGKRVPFVNFLQKHCKKTKAIWEKLI